MGIIYNMYDNRNLVHGTLCCVIFVEIYALNELRFGAFVVWIQAFDLFLERIVATDLAS
ncbi:MAG: Uncharacterised protein [Cryomorphaceae bacterium]|nr:MAG: Uncharacterised protein [Cryomorphaceae bacterium]